MDTYKQLIIDAMVTQLGISDEEAEKRYNDSALPELMVTDIQFVGHYPPEYWIENNYV